jgi:hypothetical protein
MNRRLRAARSWQCTSGSARDVHLSSAKIEGVPVMNRPGLLVVLVALIAAIASSPLT